MQVPSNSSEVASAVYPSTDSCGCAVRDAIAMYPSMLMIYANVQPSTLICCNAIVSPWLNHK